MVFPVVPNVPGVPPLIRAPGAFLEPVALLFADAITGLFGVGPLWGIFQDGQAVVTPETIVSFGYRQNWTIADFPIEQGGFESYDKVASPFEIRVRMASSGTAEARQRLLDEIAAIAGTLELFDVVTADASYPSVNIARYDYRQTSREGVGMIVIDVVLMEIRDTAVAAFSNTKSPSGAGQVNGGTVQATTPTPAQSTTFSERFAF